MKGISLHTKFTNLNTQNFIIVSRKSFCISSLTERRAVKRLQMYSRFNLGVGLRPGNVNKILSFRGIIGLHLRRVTTN
jgi:hypothetical protein